MSTPRPLRRTLGLAGMAQEFLDYASVRLMAALPPMRKTATAATQRLLQNEESRAMLPRSVRAASRIFNHALLTVVPEFPVQDDGRYVMWVSPMESRKGPALALEAIAKTRQDIPLIMVGDGPQRRNLERRAARLGIADRVEFTGRVTRERVVTLMRGATTIVFTGLREEGGLALAEAMHSARRVVVLDIGGAGAVARAATDPSRVELVAPADLNTVATRFAVAIESHFDADPVGTNPLISRAESLAELGSVVTAAREAGT